MFSFPKALAATSLAATGLLFTSHSASAADANTVPLGYVTYTALGNSDTTISLPFERKAAFVGKIGLRSEVNQGTAQDPDYVVTMFLAGTPGPQWSDDELVPTTVPPVAPDRDSHYVLIASGDGEEPPNENFVGCWFEITANTSNSITFGTGAVSILPELAVGTTTVRIIPFNTLDSVFPAGKGVHPSPSFFTINSEIRMPDPDAAGIGKAPSEKFYYTSAGTPGWRRIGSGAAENFGFQAIAPDIPITVRHNVTSGGNVPGFDDGRTQITPMGTVSTTTFKTVMVRLAAGSPQDNDVAINAPIDLTLGETNLYESGAFAASTPPFSITDELHVYDNTVVGKSKGPSAKYYYFLDPAGTNGGPGWRKIGAPLNQLFNSENVFSLTTSVVIRRGAGPISSVNWDFTPSYLPNFGS